jgi:hypothetical protein
MLKHDTELAAAAERSPLPPNLGPSGSDGQFEPQDPRAFSTAYPPIAPELESSLSQQNDGTSPLVGPTSRQWTVPGMAPTSNVRGWQNDNTRFDPQQAQQDPTAAFTHSDERLGLDFLLDGGQREKVNGGPQPSSPSLPRALPYYAMLPKSTPPTCPLDTLLMDFITKQQSQASQGVPMKTLVGPAYPNFTVLKYPDRNIESHTLSRFFTDILRTFPDISQLPEQVAILYVMFLFMRWHIDPTPENYERLPDWITPRPSQLSIPHPIWMDYLPW